MAQLVAPSAEASAANRLDHLARIRVRGSGVVTSGRLEFFAVFTAAFLVCLARSVHPSQRFSLWGEDGPIFTGQARHLGVVHSLFTGYAGYFNLLPRAVAAAVSSLPLEWTPPLYTCAAFTIASVATAASFRAARRGLDLPTWAAGLLAATVLLLPPSGAETFATLTNVEWYCEVGVVVFFAAWWIGWKARPFPTAILLFVALATSPVSIVFLPLMLARTFYRRSRLDYAVVAATALATTYQGVGHLVSPSAPFTAGYDLPRLGAMYSVRVVDDTLAGNNLAYTAWSFLGPIGSVLIGLVLLACLAALTLHHRDRSERGMAVVLILLSLVLFFFPAIERGLDQLPHLGMPTNGDGFPLGGRYMGSPSICLVLATLVLLNKRTGSNARSTVAELRQVSLGVLCGTLGILLLYNTPLDLQRQPLNIWEHAVSMARHSCRLQHGSGIVAIPNSPGLPWEIRLSCHEAFG